MPVWLKWETSIHDCNEIHNGKSYFFRSQLIITLWFNINSASEKDAQYDIIIIIMYEIVWHNFFSSSRNNKYYNLIC